MSIFDTLRVLEKDREVGRLFVVRRDIKEMFLVTNVRKEIQKWFDSSFFECLLFTGNV